MELGFESGRHLSKSSAVDAGEILCKYDFSRAMPNTFASRHVTDSVVAIRASEVGTKPCQPGLSEEIAGKPDKDHATRSLSEAGCPRGREQRERNTTLVAQQGDDQAENLQPPSYQQLMTRCSEEDKLWGT